MRDESSRAIWISLTERITNVTDFNGWYLVYFQIEINYFKVMKCQGKDVGRRETTLFEVIRRRIFRTYQNVANQEIFLIAGVAAMYQIDYLN